MATKLPFLKTRRMAGAWIVIRMDHYQTTPSDRGQFYPDISLGGQSQSIGIWPTEKQAIAAAEWAINKFGKEYGVFKLIAYTQSARVPMKITRVR